SVHATFRIELASCQTKSTRYSPSMEIGAGQHALTPMVNQARLDVLLWTAISEWNLCGNQLG
nr:hypothetical protein [Alphaproteobacteria bacterium]